MYYLCLSVRGAPQTPRSLRARCYCSGDLATVLRRSEDADQSCRNKPWLGHGGFFNSVDIGVSLVTTLCYQSLMPFTLELPQVCPAERTSREIQACAYPYVQVIMCSATVSVSILFPNTSCYETMVLVVDNFARLLRIVFYMPVSCRF